MKRWKEKLEAMAAAVSFAEAGDWKTARDLMRKGAEERATVHSQKRSRPSDRPRARMYRT
ncbi:hypothetical protein [Desulfosoma caldarium]|uniref:Uncharacterized protein n=1 Tax=Desulfosoma caldarium TaxID=610254 RepID=A0A3N1VSP0_9BACT|nr:hypothetical protein [Desulfosoma caldarium]ROR03242.1 hypothetical protein EDC27_0504 [Desulfosoma caldarium]